MSLYSRFYEVTILESTYATGEGKEYKCIYRCLVTFAVGKKQLASYA
jgi:hypothetical protein